MGLHPLIATPINRKAVAQPTACGFIFLFCLAILVTACKANREPMSAQDNLAVTTNVERDKQIEKAREEARAVLAARKPEPETVPATSQSARRILANAETSPEALCRNLLNALARQDLEALKAMRITKDEFCNYLFPELPSSRLPNVTCDFVWQQATLKSDGGFYKMYPQHQGKKYAFVALRFAKGQDTYSTYRIHKASLITVRDETGKQQELRLFGSLLEMDGKYKLISFVMD
ncbi:MAG: hypothetical protein AB1757_24275 [Acidobacteriota bacterium]